MGSGRKPDVRAAGAVVWRVGEHGVEVALVHRQRYDDWSLPKGKLEAGESAVGAAVREVAEEAGSTIALSRRLPTVRYDVGSSRKEVCYWLARHVDGKFEPNDEVDELAWVGLRAAASHVSYAADRKVLTEAARIPVPESIVVLVRHARAGKRSAWKGDDRDRPLDKSGRAQAERLSSFLAAFGPTRVLSAEPERCTQTVAPYAASNGMPVVVEPAFGDVGYDADPDAAVATLRREAHPGRVTAIASQGRAVPSMLDALWPRHRLPDTKKGHAWVLGFVDGEVAFADHYPDASR